MSFPDPTPLLFARDLAREDVERILGPYGITNARRADANIQQMAGSDLRTRQLLGTVLGNLLEEAAKTAEPDQVLTSWERFLEAAGSRAPFFDFVRQSPRVMQLICTIFGGSPALSQILIRDPHLIYWLMDESVIQRSPTKRGLLLALGKILANLRTTEHKLEALRRFKRREILRIGVRDMLRLSDVARTTAALSSLAGVVIQAAYELIDQELEILYGVPVHPGRGGRPCRTGFAVIAMGKLGGGELNFSSDVDLLYVYASEGGATSPQGPSQQSIPNEAYFEFLARDLTRVLSTPTQEGYLFRVDLRLRAEGVVGKLARSCEEYVRYYQERGQTWERLALLKAWPIAGSSVVGRSFLKAVSPFVYFSERDMPPTWLLERVKEMKNMIDLKVRKRGETVRNIKLGKGGIREIEFLVQTIQVMAGASLPAIRDRHTGRSLGLLQEQGLLTSDESRALSQAYQFLRDVEHKLQLVHDLQTHTLPQSAVELQKCALRLGYGRSGREDVRPFLKDLEFHRENVHRLFRDVFDEPHSSPIWQRVLATAGRTG